MKILIIAHELLMMRQLCILMLLLLPKCFVCYQGVVTSVSDVKPLMSVATYVDDISGCEVFQLVKGGLFRIVPSKC